MLRRCCSSVFAIGVLTLSCGEGKPGDGAGVALAQVDALPPVSAKAEDESRVAVQLREFLQRQRSSFTQREIRELAHVIAEESAHHRLDPQLVLAVIYVESRFDCFAVSPVGALGLMQIMPATGRELAKRLGIPWNGPLTLFDPIVNVRIGTAYVRQLTDRYGSVRTALAAYNWGPGYVDRQLREGTPVPAVYPGLVFSAYDQKVALRKSQAS